MGVCMDVPATAISGRQEILAVLNMRPQDRFRNLKSYVLDPLNDVLYCAFKVQAPRRPGIYRILISDRLVYIGRASNLQNRLSSQYGNVSPRHPFAGGQLQKCRTNAKINEAIVGGEMVFVEWEVCEDFVAREAELLRDAETRPPWNRRA
jgi:hypothetical protein